MILIADFVLSFMDCHSLANLVLHRFLLGRLNDLQQGGVPIDIVAAQLLGEGEAEQVNLLVQVRLQLLRMSRHFAVQRADLLPQVLDLPPVVLRLHLVTAQRLGQENALVVLRWLVEEAESGLLHFGDEDCFLFVLGLWLLHADLFVGFTDDRDEQIEKQNHVEDGTKHED